MSSEIITKFNQLSKTLSTTKWGKILIIKLIKE